jgi:hypothetical protein
MTRYAAALLMTSICWLAGPLPARAQGPSRPQPPQNPPVTFDDARDAHETREQLQRLLRQYPPAVAEVLQRDPSLMSRPDYLAPYPALVAFLTQHPEVPRNPAFFFGSFSYHPPNPGERATEVLAIVFGGMAGAGAFLAVISLLVWVIRSVIDHRRWLRLSRVQTEVHTKLMDRLTTNEDLLAYIQSPAGRRFLESAPITLEGEPRQTSAPIGRILWSLQAGIVLVALGIGFWFARSSVISEVAEGFYVLGVVVMALGAGFAVSAVASFLISSRLGLMSPSRPPADA